MFDVKNDIATAAASGIAEYLRSTQGANRLGAGAKVRVLNNNIMLMARDPVSGEMVETCLLLWSEEGEF